jgi:hypothetical protein
LFSVAFGVGWQVLDHPVLPRHQLDDISFPRTKLAGDEEGECDRRHTTEIIFAQSGTVRPRLRGRTVPVATSAPLVSAILGGKA